jgi:long-chain acyl-CoA synthetase
VRWPNVAEFLKEKVQLFGSKPLVCDYGGETFCTYQEFDERTDRLAWTIGELGISPGDRVAFLHPNHTDLLLGYFGVMKASAVAVPINPIYTPREISYIINNSGARLLISLHSFAETVEAATKVCPKLAWVIVKPGEESLEEALTARVGKLKERKSFDSGPDDLAMIFYTSGTTGRPKGVMLTHRNITFGGGNCAQNYGLTPSDRTIICLPLTHIFANATPFLGSLSSGGSAVVMDRFQTNQVFDAIAGYRATWFPGVPTMFTYLLDSFDERVRDVSSLRMGLSGAASLSIEHLSAFEEKFDATLLEVYGLTESTGLVTANPVFGVRKPGSIGISVSGVSVRLVDQEMHDVATGDVGELIFKGPNASPGYWELEEETAEAICDGWLFTGDLAYQDREGFFYIVSRKKELIISGGYNVYPREIEDILMQHSGILEAAVIGVKDPALGEVPKAFVVLKPGIQMDAEELKGFCKKNLARYKVPRHVKFIDALPRNTTGKILKQELK